MSRSPGEDASSEQVRAYDVGWAATNKLIRSGRSFSGRERNCAFLNLGNEKRFADISSASGLDFPDDGRGLALSDWDHDGRIDLWMMNRTGPRLRFVRNELETENHFIALRLAGTNGNRAGIGARVHLNLETGLPVLVKSLRAGSGYLSQSSKWLHFGLGDKNKINSINVQWPGGKLETFTGASANGHFILEQGKGIATRWHPPSVSLATLNTELADSPVPPEVPSRVVLLNPAPIPAHLTFTNSTGKEESLFNRFREQTTILHLWATWCPNCEKELPQWAASAKDLSDAGIRVLSICVDEPGEDRQADLSQAKAFATELGYPFEVGLANAALIENLNILQRTFIGRQSDLPIPSTILIDQSGRASAVYKGPVSTKQLAKDAKVCGADSATILTHAIPYPGKWKTPPKGLLPRSVAVKMISNGLLDDARSYLLQLLPLYEDSSDQESLSEAAECQRVLGAIAHQKEEFQTAIKHYLHSLKIVPDQKPVRTELMRVYLRTEEIAKAAEQIEAILALQRTDHENLAQLGKLRQQLGQTEQAISLYRESLSVRFHPETSTALANLLRSQGNCTEALKHYAASLEARPKNALAANNYAWILATHPDAKLRDGAKAQQWAQLACEITNNKIPPLLGTLAAAHAELSEFDRAIEISKMASASAREYQKEDLA
ncbi:ASPIC/UnbV domain-containing protein, partial [Akkermansiaceae bacterium]|nr:ASPIC/UnbV domain-containing protein [Akkermansiaceae bacterium]